MPIGSGTNYYSTVGMGLSLPIPGQCGALGIEPPGKSWLELLNSSLGLVDAHNHTPGFGSQVPAAGLNINADLPFGLNNATGLRSARFSAIALGGLGISDVGCLIVSGADLYYVDTAGNQIRLTSGGALAGTPGSISGLASPAAVSYTPASKLFAFTSSSGFVANLSCGPLSIGDASASGGKAATISVPAGLTGNYALTLPAALPASTKILTLTSAGAIGATYDVDGTTLQIASSVLSVKTAGLSGITGSQLAANTVARGQLAAVGQQVSGSIGTFNVSSTTYADVTGATLTITTSGRPVIVRIQGDSSGTGGTMQPPSPTTGLLYLQLVRDTTVVSAVVCISPANNTVNFVPDFGGLDAPPAGSHTYKLQARVNSGSGFIQNCVLVAYEL